VKSEQELPADMVPLACSGDEGTCYVSTANLDGETNLKLKAASSTTQEALCDGSHDAAALLEHVLNQLGNLQGTVEAEAPVRSIHTFNGAISLEGKSKQALSAKEFLLRGTMLRNTAWCVGIVVYTGSDTRVVMNSRKTPVKLANIERVINITLVVVLLVQLLLAIISDVAYNVEESNFKDYSYIDVVKTDFPPALAYLFTFFILYSNMMPISLYATLELCNTAQAFFVKNDLQMYDEETDSPAIVRSTNLCQELGQVEYIFSDKTGTLTQNVMELKRVSIAGEMYGEVGEAKGFVGGKAMEQAKAKSSQQATAIANFLEVLAVSHTVVVNEDKDGKKKFEAESPDEGALVETAGQLGWVFVGRVGAVMDVEVNGQRRTYQVEALNAFNSTRKRMSVIVKADSGEYLLLVKGADNVMMERAQSPDPVLDKHLEEFAKEGLRTLIIGRRVLSEAEFNSWHQQYDAAQTSIADREGKLMAAAETIEKDLELVGATAIEDKLQVGVGETIVKIRGAGIKLWVLTGDKLETARNIGFSTRVLSDDMEIPVIDVESAQDDAGIKKQIDELKPHIEQCIKEGVVVGMMVTGAALEGVTSGGLDAQFLELARMCSVVIACRVSPLQKAQMVALVRQGVKPQPVTLAVGDGANDVPMIQEAQVGVGIVGKEGRQAVNAADFAIGQFRFLQRLLLLHGRWNYRRTCKFTLYTFWRNAVQVLLMFYFSFMCGSAGTTIFEDKIRMSFNFILSFPILATGCFDRDVDEQVVLRTPALYEVGRKGLDLNPVRMMQNLLSAVMHSLVILFLCLLAAPSMDALGAGDLYTWGTAMYTLLIIDCIYRVAFLTITWNKYVVILISFATGLYVAGCCFYGSITLGTSVMKSVTYKMAGNITFWICLVAMIAMVMVIDYFLAYLNVQFRPDLKDRVLEDPTLTDELHLAQKKEESAKTSVRDASVRMSMARTDTSKSSLSSYAFDHPDHPTARSHTSLKVAHPKAGDTSHLDQKIEQATPQTTLKTKSSGIVAESNRPRDTPLAQQKLPSVQFRLTLCTVLTIMTTCGFILIVLGIIALVSSNSAAQIRIQYDGDDVIKPAGTKDAEFQRVSCPVGQHCTVHVTASQEMKAPIWAFYILDPFYQNYNSYVKKVAADFGDQILSPEMRFNDTFEIIGEKGTLADIAWATDMDRFSCDDGDKCTHDVLWERPGAMASIQKPFMKLDSTSFSKGQKIEVKINSHFPTASLGARKELVLTTLTTLGGRSNTFGTFLIFAGVLCLVGDLFVLLVRTLCPRKPGRTRADRGLEQASLTEQRDPGQGSLGPTNQEQAGSSNVEGEVLGKQNIATYDI